MKLASSLALLLVATLGVACSPAVDGESGSKKANGHLAGADDEGDDEEDDDGVPGECKPGAVRSCDAEEGGVCNELCIIQDGEAAWGDRCEAPQEEVFQNPCACARSECGTPLVLSFDGAGVAFTEQPGLATFDLTGAGMCVQTDWPTAKTPWLVLDRNGNGVIDDGGELFGSATKLASGELAHNGFEALRQLDANADRTFDARDPAFPQVRVWADKDLDRVSSAGELRSLADLGVESIDLSDLPGRRCDDRGNCEGERSAFRYRDAAGVLRTGTVIDVYLRYR